MAIVHRVPHLRCLRGADGLADEVAVKHPQDYVHVFLDGSRGRVTSVAQRPLLVGLEHRGQRD